MRLRKIVTIVGTLFCALLIASCGGQKSNYLYLMLHPDYLQQVYNQCVEVVATSSQPCETIMRAQADFTVLASQREEDAERFGAQILQAQENSIYLKLKLAEVWKAYKTLGKAEHTLEQLKDKRIELDKARAAYNTSVEKVGILLSVVAATSSI